MEKLSELPNGSINDNWHKLSRKSLWGNILQNCVGFNSISLRHSSLIGVCYGY